MAIQPGLGAQGIAANWGSAPTLSAPSIGSMVAAILEDKRAREKQLRDAVSGTIGNVRGEMQSNAYLEAAKEAGIIPEGFEAGGLGGAQLGSTLAKQIEAQKLAALRGGLIEAQTQGALARAGKEQTLADYIRQHGTTPGRGGGTERSLLDENGVERAVGETWIGSDGKERIMTYNRGPKLTAVGLQPSDQRTQNENQMLKEQAGLLEAKSQMDADKAKQEAEDRAANRPNNPYKLSDQYNRTVNRLKQLQQSRAIPSTQPEASPQPSPAETGDTLPTSKVQPTTGGADKNVAQGYGTSATGMSADDVREAYRAGKMTRAEAAARLKQLGFSD